MKATSGKPACIFETLSQKLLERGYVFIKRHPDKIPSSDKSTDVENKHESKTTPIVLSDKMITNPNATCDLDSIYFWPKYNMTFPDNIRVGEPFDVVWDCIPDT